MPIDARLKRLLQDGTISDWLLRDPDAIDEVPTDPVSDKAVRATLGTVADDATLNTVIGMLHKVVNRLAATLSVAGTVALDAPTLASLENINALVSGVVEISNPTANPETGLAKETTLGLALNKLQDIFAAVDGLEVTAENIEISSESINLQTDEVEALLQVIRDRLPLALDNDGGVKVHVQNPTANPETGLAKDASVTQIRDRLPTTIDPDGGIKVHNQNLPAVQSVSGNVGVTNFPSVQTVDGEVDVGNFPADYAKEATISKELTLAALLDEFRNRFDAVEPAAQTFLTAGTHVLVTPPSGQRIRTVWFFAQAKGSFGEGFVEVRFMLGTRQYIFELTGSQPFMHSAIWEGAVDQQLLVTLDVNAPVIVNCDYRTY